MDEPVRRGSARIFIGFMWLTFMVLMTTYTGNLIAFLTVSIEKLPANNLKELAEQETHDVGVMGGSSHELVFRVSNTDVFFSVAV